MSKHEQLLEASIHFWVLREEKRSHEPAHECKCAQDSCTAEKEKNAAKAA